VYEAAAEVERAVQRRDGLLLALPAPPRADGPGADAHRAHLDTRSAERAHLSRCCLRIRRRLCHMVRSLPGVVRVPKAGSARVGCAMLQIINPWQGVAS